MICNTAFRWPQTLHSAVFFKHNVLVQWFINEKAGKVETKAYLTPMQKHFQLNSKIIYCSIFYFIWVQSNSPKEYTSELLTWQLPCSTSGDMY